MSVRFSSKNDGWGGTNSVNIVSDLLSGIILCRSLSIDEKCMRGNQGSFRPGRRFIDQLFTLRQITERGCFFMDPRLLSSESDIRLSRPCSSDVACHRGMCRGKLFHFSNQYITTVKADFVLGGGESSLRVHHNE